MDELLEVVSRLEKVRKLRGEDTKETMKQRKTKARSEPMVLVAFGNHTLKELMAKKDTMDGEERLMTVIDEKHWPPVYRRVSICSIEDVELFQEYLAWVAEMLGFTGEVKEEL